MAIVKDVETEFGNTFKYHKIRDVRIINSDKVGVQIGITVESYATKEARIAGKSPVKTENIITGADFALEPFYKLLTAKFDQYADADDDFDNSFKVTLADTKGRKVRYSQQTVHGQKISEREEII